jgi:hypothetical protein
MKDKRNTDEAILKMWQFKPTEMRTMMVRVLKLALTGVEFSANDLPVHGQEAHGGSGIAGAAVLQLKRDGILAPVGKWVDGKFYPEVVLNAGGNKIGVYRLAKPELARTLLGRQSGVLCEKPSQDEFFAQPARWPE